MGGLLHLVQRGGAWAGCDPAPTPFLTVPNVTAHPSTASVPITVLLYDGPLLCGFNVAIEGLKQSVTMSFCLSVCLSVCLFVRLSPKTRTCRVLADWPSSAGGRASRERPVRCWASQPVHDGGGQGLSRRPLRPN